MLVRKAAIEALHQVLHHSVKAGEAVERHSSFMQPQQRRLLHEMVFGALRHFFSLEADYSRFCRTKPDPLAQMALLVGSYQLRLMRVANHAAVSETVSAISALQPKAAGFVNAVLRRVADNEPPKKLKPHQRADLPRWIYTAWRDAFGADQVLQMAEALKRPPQLCLALFCERENWMQQVNELGIEAKAGELSPYAVLLPTGTDVTLLPGFADGQFTVMDQAAQHAVLALELPDPNALIVDLCAAPGGKTALLSHRFPDARVIAVELNARRIPRLRENLKRLKCPNVDIVQADGLVLPFADNSVDAIFLDAPCSASGVYRRNPDAKFLHDQNSLTIIAGLQSQLIKRSLTALKSGGKMVYAVCSIHAGENEMVVEQFTNNYKHQRLLATEVNDGFFFACLDGTEH